MEGSIQKCGKAPGGSILERQIEMTRRYQRQIEMTREMVSRASRTTTSFFLIAFLVLIVIVAVSAVMKHTNKLESEDVPRGSTTFAQGQTDHHYHNHPKPGFVRRDLDHGFPKGITDPDELYYELA